MKLTSNQITKITIIILLATIILFPTKRPGAIMNQATGQLISEVDIVEISPILFLKSRTESNSIRIAPRLSSYSENGPIELVATSVEIVGNELVSQWSFAFGYWLFLIVVPCISISYLVLFIRNKKLVGNS